jgi:hypothetical protein
MEIEQDNLPKMARKTETGMPPRLAVAYVICLRDLRLNSGRGRRHYRLATPVVTRLVVPVELLLIAALDGA